jgi:tetratricopeptide (TPR) repeat protein
MPQKNVPISKNISAFKLLFVGVIMAASVVFTFLEPQNAGAALTREDFFSYGRVSINRSGLSGGRDGLVVENIDAFLENYTYAQYYISIGELKKAESYLLEARRRWPEYYATDFMLALLYEDTGRYRKAARYYKSYLNKLKKLQTGHYRISGSLMLSLSSSGMVEYNEAYNLVKMRMNKFGINIENVTPAPYGGDPLAFIFFSLLLISVGLLFYYKFLPFYRKRKKLKRTPEGYWGCPRCGTYNPELRHECEKCGFRK